MDSKELSVISQDKYTDEMLYRYEPIAGCDDISEATELCEHIGQIGVQDFFIELTLDTMKTEMSKLIT